MSSSTKKRKILIVGPAYPYRGGNSLFVSHLYFQLADEFEVKIFNFKLLYPSILFPGTTQYDKSESIYKKAPNERIVNSINPLNWFSTAKKIFKENPDLVVFDWWHPFFGPCHFVISFLLKNKLRSKILFITENFVSHEGHFMDKVLTRIGLNNAGGFLALSGKVADELNEIKGARKVYRSELPVYDCYQTSESSKEQILNQIGLSKSDKILLFFGYVRKYKGLDILLNAAPEIFKLDSNFKLLVVGEFYDNPEDYFSLITKHQIESKVTIINRFVSNEEVQNYYSIADLVVLPYRSATQSGILNIAYGFGKPVLVTNVGGLSEFVENESTGIIVAPESTMALVEGVRKYLELADKTDFKNNIQIFVKKNSFQNIQVLFKQIVLEMQI
jgi:glycosyltransferase involved in cell wall biosynthesis